MDTKKLERRSSERPRSERVRVVKLAGSDRYLARSRTVEPGAYYDLAVTPWGAVRCSCPGFAFRRVCDHAAALKERLERQRSQADLSRPAQAPELASSKWALESTKEGPCMP